MWVFRCERTTFIVGYFAIHEIIPLRRSLMVFTTLSLVLEHDLLFFLTEKLWIIIC